MADRNDAWARFAKKQQSKKEDSGSTARARAEAQGTIAPSSRKPEVARDELDELIEQVDPLLEQLNQLYNMYLAGVEKRAPIERRKVLDSIMARIQGAAKTNLSQKFKANSILARYQSHTEKWDKLMRGLEGGKVRRRVG